MIQNLIFGILFLKILFRHTAFLYPSTRYSGHHHFLLIFRFSSRKSQSQQKLEKNDTQFTIQFRSKNVTHFYKSQLIWHWKWYDPASNTVKNLSDFTQFPANTSLFHVRKNISWRPKITFMKHLGRKCLCISVHLCKKIIVSKT